MAKKNTTTASATVEVTNKSQAIKDFAKANPTAKPAEISKALAGQGVEVSAGRVSNVLAKAKPRVDVEQIKAASQFVKNYKGDLSEATAAINSVGSFVEACGSAAAALAALEAYGAVAAAVA